eukprot:14647283-Alexandrium_andersonii.AAC.1
MSTEMMRSGPEAAGHANVKRGYCELTGGGTWRAHCVGPEDWDEVELGTRSPKPRNRLNH